MHCDLTSSHLRLLVRVLVRHDSISKYEIGPKATDLTVLLALFDLDLSLEFTFISEVLCLLNLDPWHGLVM